VFDLQGKFLLVLKYLCWKL